MVFIYKVNGVDKEFTEKDLMSLPEGAEFVDRKDKIIVQGYLPPIHDFKLELAGDDTPPQKGTILQNDFEDMTAQNWFTNAACQYSALADFRVNQPSSKCATFTIRITVVSARLKRLKARTLV